MRRAGRNVGDGSKLAHLVRLRRTKFEQSELEQARGFEAVDAERGARSTDGSAGGHEPDELGAHDLRPACVRLRAYAGDDLVQRRRLPVLNVHRDLDESDGRELEPERADAREAAAALSDERRDLAGGGERAAEI